MNDQIDLKTMLINGFSRFYSESGSRYWSRADLEGTLQSIDYPEKLDSPSVQLILQELESRHYIQILRNDERLYRGLRYRPDHNERKKCMKIIRGMEP